MDAIKSKTIEQLNMIITIQEASVKTIAKIVLWLIENFLIAKNFELQIASEF